MTTSWTEPPGGELFADAGVLDTAAPALAINSLTAAQISGGPLWSPWRAAHIAAQAHGVACLNPESSAPWPSHSQAAVLVVKGRAAAEADIARAWQAVPVGGVLVVAGATNAGIKSIVSGVAKRLGRAGEVVANRARARAVRWQRTADDPSWLPPVGQAAVVPDGLPGAGLGWDTPPGVFSAGALDAGSALLLADLATLAWPAPPRRVLDLACGCGPLLLGAGALFPGVRLQGADADARAVVAARAALTAAGHPSAEVVWWSAGEATPASAGSIDLVVTNPPAHTGLAGDLDPARALFREIDRVLAPGGRALVVANRQLPYEQPLAALGQLSQRQQDGVYKLLLVER